MARRGFRFTVAVLAGSLCCAVASVHAEKIGPEEIARFLADYAAMAIEFDHDYAFAELTPENSAQVAEDLLSLATGESGVCERRLRKGAWLALTAMVHTGRAQVDVVGTARRIARDTLDELLFTALFFAAISDTVRDDSPETESVIAKDLYQVECVLDALSEQIGAEAGVSLTVRYELANRALDDRYSVRPRLEAAALLLRAHPELASSTSELSRALDGHLRAIAEEALKQGRCKTEPSTR